MYRFGSGCLQPRRALGFTLVRGGYVHLPAHFQVLHPRSDDWWQWHCGIGHTPDGVVFVVGSFSGDGQWQDGVQQQVYLVPWHQAFVPKLSWQRGGDQGICAIRRQQDAGQAFHSK